MKGDYSRVFMSRLRTCSATLRSTSTVSWTSLECTDAAAADRRSLTRTAINPSQTLLLSFAGESEILPE